MHKKLLCIFAHPDDEAFGPGGTIAKYAHEGVEVHLLCATKGEAGYLHENGKEGNQEKSIDEIREQELRDATSILGVKQIDFLGFIDGKLCNSLYHTVGKKIEEKIHEFEPQVILTFDKLGVSGHIDHMAMAMITTFVFNRSQAAKKLYYWCLPKRFTDGMPEYFIYFPEGYEDEYIPTIIHTEKYWDMRVEAMYKHKSQQHDIDMILDHFGKLPREEYFLRRVKKGIQTTSPEYDFFDGL